MKKHYWLLLIALLMTLLIAGCSGSSNDQPDGDEDGDSTEDSESDGDTSENGEDGDTEEDGDNGCTCTETNACCDGCNPINEAGECDDSNACTEKDACKSGVCEGTAITCEEKVCNETGATCNSETGECEYVPLENGTDCEATEGIFGSGSCLSGECGGFGSCDNRKYGQPVGYICNFDSECESHFCYEFEFNDPIYMQPLTFKYCSQKCDEGDEPCPIGTKCVNKGGDLGYMCIVMDDFWTEHPLTLTEDGGNELYQPCSDDDDCAGGLCLITHDGTTFCSTDCTNEAGTGPDGSICGACGACKTTPDTSNISVDHYCALEGKNQAAESCGSSLDCVSGLCINNYCSATCFDINGQTTCSDGYTCTTNIYNTAVCIIDSEVTDILKPIGGECTDDRWCASKTCREGICSADCMESSCEEGTCATSDTAISVNTVISLYKDGVAEALDMDDNSYDGAFSYMKYDFTESGTYYVDVYGKYATTEGPYYLSIFAGDMNGIVAVNESEPNNDQNNANSITDEKVRIAGKLTAGDHDVYAFEVTVASARVELYIFTSPQYEKICVADSTVAEKLYGENCNDSYQCKDNRICFEGSCTEECTDETDCPNGICFPYYQDLSLCVAESQMGTLDDGLSCYANHQCEDICLMVSSSSAYCSRECTEDSDCAWGMGCDQDYCLNGNGMIYPYNNCRFDSDCDAGRSCVNDICTNSCEKDEDCEGNAPITASQYELCWPCETSADCNPEGETSPNICLNSPNGDSFCSTPCNISPSICPENARCINIGSFFPQHVCVPTSLSCDGQATCNDETDAYCIRPTLKDYQPCENADHCWGGACENDLCQTETCSVASDCECDYLTCENDYCAATAGDGTLEVEPNNTLANAQVVSGKSAIMVASLNELDNTVDVDIFKISMQPGEFLDVQTKSFCNFAADTNIRLLDSSGTLIEGWENDDIDSGGDFFSVLLGYKATTTQDVYIEVTQSQYVSGALNVGYLLAIDIFVPDANTTCDNAKELNAGQYSDDFEMATHNYSAGECAGYNAGGKDLTYYISVPAKNILEVALDADYYIQVSMVTDCSDLEKSCLDGVTLTNPDEGPVTAKWANESDASVQVFLIVDSWLTEGDTTFSLDLALTEIVTPVNNTGDGAIAVPAGESSYDIVTYGATNDYDPGESGCAGKALIGRDVVYAVTLDVNEYVLAQTSGEYNTEMILVTDYTDLSTCVKYGRNNLVYTQAATERRVAQTYYLIVDAANEADYGEVTIDFTVESTGTCAGECDPSTYANTCVSLEKADTATLCKCSYATKAFEQVNCNDYCMENSSTSGTCVDADTDSCVCSDAN